MAMLGFPWLVNWSWCRCGLGRVGCSWYILMGCLGLKLTCAGLSQVCLVGMARDGVGLGHGVLNWDAMT